MCSQMCSQMHSVIIPSSLQVPPGRLLKPFDTKEHQIVIAEWKCNEIGYVRIFLSVLVAKSKERRLLFSRATSVFSDGSLLAEKREKKSNEQEWNGSSWQWIPFILFTESVLVYDKQSDDVNSGSTRRHGKDSFSFRNLAKKRKCLET